jgi:hypothetical protein
MSIPFRWNLARREQLGRLTDGQPAPACAEFLDDLRTCAAKTLVRSQNSDLCFVGRSPDSIFDYLGGALAETSWASRLTLVNLSLRGQDLKTIRHDHPQRLAALYDHLAAVHLDPPSLSTRGPTAFVDLVASGATFGQFVDVLLGWTLELGVDPAAVVRNIRFVGITRRTKTSPKTFRWQQHAPWLAQFARSAVKNVSIPGRLWDYLGNSQAKIAVSNPPWRWGATETLAPPHSDKNLEALRLALRVYDFGTTRSEREMLATEIAALPEMREPWARSLVLELRRTATTT